MQKQAISENKNELDKLCVSVKKLVKAGEYRKCESLISEAMQRHPHSPEPHNLFGLLLEKKNDQLTAMRHFRAAWALEPTYMPARQNLECFGEFFFHGRCAYDESDCPEKKTAAKVQRGNDGRDSMSHAVRRTR